MNSINFIRHFVLVLTFCLTGLMAEANELPVRSDINQILPYITAVKSQEGRNMCTVFALTALVELTYVREMGVEAKRVDFSEDWIQHLATFVNPSAGAKGSIVKRNYDQMKKYGIAQEKAMPFSGGLWTQEADHKEAKVIEQMCGDLSGKPLVQCLYGKTNPKYLSMSDAELMSVPYGSDYAQARQSAANLKSQFLSRISRKVLSTKKHVKSRILQNKGVVVEIDIYMGSWNHNRADEYGIHRDSKLFKSGIVTYPEKGSLDRNNSPRGVRHAVMIVGYDDEMTVRYQKKMADGSMATFERTGVYIIKNSWGTKGFGSKFRYQGKRMPGLGIITQDYVHGSFGSVLTSLEIN